MDAGGRGSFAPPKFQFQGKKNHLKRAGVQAESAIVLLKVQSGGEKAQFNLKIEDTPIGFVPHLQGKGVRHPQPDQFA
jgi:hypothetical protein